jgi:hypothetical protein
MAGSEASSTKQKQQQGLRRSEKKNKNTQKPALFL